MIIKSLAMGVDPTDSSYMPSVIVVSGGCSLTTLTELNIINVRNTDSSIQLLTELDQVITITGTLKHYGFNCNSPQHYPLIEIAIVKCRNSGIDCKVHGFTIIGTKNPPNTELKTSASFLANDWDVNQDNQSTCK